MFGLFRQYKLRKTIQAYVREIGPYLLKNYGGSGQYTVMQIQAAIKVLKLNADYMPYAIALYRHEESINTVKRVWLNQVALDEIRLTIAQLLFDGNTRYRVEHVLELCKDRGWQGGQSPSWGANKSGRTSL